MPAVLRARVAGSAGRGGPRVPVEQLRPAVHVALARGRVARDLIPAAVLQRDARPTLGRGERDLDLGRLVRGPVGLAPGQHQAPARLPGGDAPDLEALARLLELHEAPADAGLQADARRVRCVVVAAPPAADAVGEDGEGRGRVDRHPDGNLDLHQTTSRRMVPAARTTKTTAMPASTRRASCTGREAGSAPLSTTATWVVAKRPKPRL